MDNWISEQKLYQVNRYFDDHFEGIEGKDLTEDQAKELIGKLNNNRNRAYVSYGISLQQSLPSPPTNKQVKPQ